MTAVDWSSQNLSFDEVIELIDEQLSAGEWEEGQSPYQQQPHRYWESELYQSWFPAPHGHSQATIDRWMYRMLNSRYVTSYE